MALRLEVVCGAGERKSHCILRIRPTNADGSRVDRIVTARLGVDGVFEPLHVSEEDGPLISSNASGMVVIASAFGEIATVTNDHAAAMPRLEACAEYGLLRRIKVFQREVIAVGMAHQVHRCSVDGTSWTLLHVDDAKSRGTLAVTGFNALDGPDAENWAAVGFSGAIAETRGGQMRFAESPTNLVLFDVCYSRSMGWVACGQHGQLIVRDPGSEAWHDRSISRFSEDFLFVQEFRDHVYLATRRELWRWDGSSQDPRSLDLGYSPQEILGLDVAGGALWLFSAERVLVTPDGAQWSTAGRFGT